jgi:pantoate--beta-alanine ligase
MRIVQSIAQLRAALQHHDSIGLVPTMGALHDGHGALIDRSVRDNRTTVVSLFVNPLQFDRPSDLAAYPRILDADAAFAQARNADILFAPDASEMYPQPQRAFVHLELLPDHLCGRFRPGHFRGVATVVLKLLDIVRPHRAYFGEKDAQQLAIIRRMTADLNVLVEIVPVPTVREPDGLAMSSRNRLLAPNHRALAPLLFQTLRDAAQLIASGETNPETVQASARAAIAAAPDIRLEYFEIVDPAELQPVERINGPVLVALAAFLGSVRLIDNVLARPAVTEPRP